MVVFVCGKLWSCFKANILQLYYTSMVTAAYENEKLIYFNELRD
jgi:hypothetical protein